MAASFSILLVDDDPDLAGILRRAASHSFAEAEFTVARSFSQAISYVEGMHGEAPV